MAVDATSMDYAMKELYPNGVAELVYKNNPFLAMVEKDTEFFGDAMNVAVNYADTQGRSAVHATAKANAGAHAGVKFVLTRTKDYAFGIIDRETMKACGNNAGSVVKALEKETKSAINVLKNSLAHAVWGTGSGVLGRIGSISTNTITLTDANDAVNFEKGRVCVLSDTLSGGSVRTGTITVSKVNRRTGVVTFTGNVTAGIAAAANNDYIYVEGDYDAKGKGIQAWVPTSDPSATAFFSVDRTIDVERLGGIRFDGSALPIEEALIEGTALCARYEGSPDVVFMHHLDKANLIKSIGTKKEYDDIKGPAGIGFRALVIEGANQDLRVIADRNCPRGYAYGLDMSTWKYHSLGEAPHIVDDDGLTIRRGTGDNWTTEFAFYGQLACDAPGKNVVITIATT